MIGPSTRIAVLVGICVVLWAGWPVAAIAEPAAPEAEPAEYREAIELAVAEYELGNFAESRTQFRRAHELYANARSHRGLGMTEFELRNYGDAIEHLEQALRSTDKPLTGELRTQTEDLLEQARGYVARINLELDPAAAHVVVDGVPVRLGPSGVLILEVGDHVLEFRAPGRVIEKRSVKVIGGEKRTLRVELRDEGPLGERRRWYKNPWLWTAVGVVAAGAATSIALTRDREGELAKPAGGNTMVSLVGPGPDGAP